MVEPLNGILGTPNLGVEGVGPGQNPCPPDSHPLVIIAIKSLSGLEIN